MTTYWKRTGRYVPIITDGGMTTGGDVCKAFASGADAVMIGSAFARAIEAPGGATTGAWRPPTPNLPRGTRIRVGIAGSLEQILFGPAFTEDGTLNLVGAIRTCACLPQLVQLVSLMPRKLDLICSLAASSSGRAE